MPQNGILNRQFKPLIPNIRRGVVDTYAVGHLSIGYLTAKFSAKLLKQNNINLPVIFVLSMIPDFDLLVPQLIHRGVTHSLILISIMFLPILVVKRKKALPYFIALIQHPILGDLPTGEGIMVLWPLNSNFYGLGLDLRGDVIKTLEIFSFVAMLTIMLLTRDIANLTNPHMTTPLLLIPMSALVSSVMGIIPASIPAELVIPHLILILIFAVALLSWTINRIRKA